MDRQQQINDWIERGGKLREVKRCVLYGDFEYTERTIVLDGETHHITFAEAEQIKKIQMQKT